MGFINIYSYFVLLLVFGHLEYTLIYNLSLILILVFCVTLLERRRAVEFDNIPSVRISRFSRHFLATRETIFEGDDSKPVREVAACGPTGCS